MKCRHFFSFALVLFLSFFFGSFITTNNSFAVSDLTATIDDSSSTFSFSCGSDCSSYHYLLASDFSLTGGINFYLCPYSNNNFARLTFNIHYDMRDNLPFILYSFDNADQMVVCGRSWSSGSSVKLTLSENNPFGSPPVGDISITSNGIYDVSSYATATVDVPAEAVPGDYHDDLVNIQKSIIICGAILLVLYFFYCIYRLIIKNSGVH